MSKKFIIHCSDTPNGRDDGAEDIHRWHKERGFDGIGYHYVIRIDGTVEPGRPEYWTGAHCRGHNDRVGICLIGRDKFTEKQEDALCKLLFISGEGDIDVVSHYELDGKKTCPNFDARGWSLDDECWPLLELR